MRAANLMEKGPATETVDLSLRLLDRLASSREAIGVSDLAREFALPVLVVAANKLGALNHTLLTVEAVRQAGQRCLGVIWNDTLPAVESPATATNRAILDSLVQLPMTLHVQNGQEALHEPDIATLLSVIRQQ